MLLFSFGITNQINTVECLNVFILVTKISLKHSPDSCFDLELQSKKYCTVQGSTMKTTSFLQCRTCLLAKTATKALGKSVSRSTDGRQKKEKEKAKIRPRPSPFSHSSATAGSVFLQSCFEGGRKRRKKARERRGGICVRAVGDRGLRRLVRYYCVGGSRGKQERINLHLRACYC